MKKFIAIAAMLSMLLTICIPNVAADAEIDTAKQLEALILKAKGAIEIPDSYEVFSSNSRTDENGVTYWSLNWSEKSPSEYWDRSSIAIEICDNGFISSYSKYESGKRYYEYVKIPTLSMEEANKRLKDFVEKVCPEIQSEIVWKDPVVNDGSYFYNFNRVVNGIEANFNNASFTVDGFTGEINSYYSNWNTTLDFPLADKAISLENAKSIYKEKMPLNLEYRIDNGGRVYIQYAPSREQGGFYINAITGELEKIEYYYTPYSSMGMGGYAKDMANSALLPGEQKEVDSIAGLITVAQAEQKLRAIGELKLDDSYKLSSSYLSQNKTSYNDETMYYLNLYFTKLDNGEELTDDQIKLKIAAGNGEGSANAGFNAKTGELISFSSYSWNVERKADDIAVNKEDGKKTADAFIEKYLKDKAGSLKYIDNRNEAANYQYYRMENGIYFDYQGTNITVDTNTGKISDYNCSWTENVTIPSTTGVISTDKAHELMFEAVGFKLEYVLNNRNALLVYKLNDQSPQFIDAMSGEHLNYDGKPYKSVVTPKYNDIEGHFAETAIKELTSVGVFLNGDSFSPDSNILQKDYIKLLSKLGKYYYNSENDDAIYYYLIRNGIMTEKEKNPDGDVTREDAVKFLLRYLDYKRLAEIPEIFKCDFVDAADINPALTGYATIAKGLGLINGSDGYFKPKDVLTKGEAAVIIYNCLKANV